MPLLNAQRPVAKKLINCLSYPDKYTNGKMYLSGEMGVGKTYIASYVLSHFIQNEFAVAIVPPQVVNKWNKVMHEYMPKAKIRIYRSMKDINHNIKILTSPNSINIVSNIVFTPLFNDHVAWGKTPSEYKQKLAFNVNSVKNQKSFLIYDEIHQIKNKKLKCFRKLVKDNSNMQALMLTGTIFNAGMRNLGKLIKATNPVLYDNNWNNDNDVRNMYESNISAFMHDIWQYISVSLSMQDIKQGNHTGNNDSGNKVHQSIMPIHSINIDNEELAYYHMALAQLESISGKTRKAELLASEFLDNPKKDLTTETINQPTLNRVKLTNKNFIAIPLVNIELRETKKYKRLLSILSKTSQNDNVIIYASDHELIKGLVINLKRDGYHTDTLSNDLPADKYSSYINNGFKSGTQVFIVDPKEVNVGVDINANVLVWYQLLSNLTDIIQAQRRVYRISSKRNSKVYILAYSLTYQIELVKEISNAAKYNAASYGTQEKDPLAKLTGVLLGGLNKKTA